MKVDVKKTPIFEWSRYAEILNKIDKNRKSYMWSVHNYSFQGDMSLIYIPVVYALLNIGSKKWENLVQNNYTDFYHENKGNSDGESNKEENT